MKDTLAIEYSDSIGVRKRKESAKRDQIKKARKSSQDELKQNGNPARAHRVYQTSIH